MPLGNLPFQQHLNPTPVGSFQSDIIGNILRLIASLSRSSVDFLWSPRFTTDHTHQRSWLLRGLFSYSRDLTLNHSTMAFNTNTPERPAKRLRPTENVVLKDLPANEFVQYAHLFTLPCSMSNNLKGEFNSLMARGLQFTLGEEISSYQSGFYATIHLILIVRWMEISRRERKHTLSITLVVVLTLTRLVW